MKIKLALLQTFLFVLCAQFVMAQAKEVTGTVTSADDNQPLPGATVVIDGTTTGTVTDVNGKYKIKASPGQILDFSYIGMQTQKITVGDANSYDVALKAGVELQETVVTALGVSREKKSLGYSTQQVSGDEASTVKTDNFVNNLSGQISGLQIKTNNNIGGSTNVIIRGNSSLLGNNQALFVVDGVPMSNENTNTSYQMQGGRGYDYGNAISDINPDEIASINVLKGAAATALYGSRAANGVIMITTKKGSKSTGKGAVGVSLSSNVTTGFIDKSTFPTYQKSYGAGYGKFYGPNGDAFFNQYDVNGDGVPDLVVPFTEDASFGAPFDANLNVYQWDAFVPESPYYKKPRPWLAAEHTPVDFFQHSLSFDNNIALHGGSDKGTYRISFENYQSRGILPNSSIKRNNVGIRGSYNLTDKVRISGSANYVGTNGKGRNVTGYDGNIMTNFRQWWETNVDVKELQDLYNQTRRNVTWNRNGYNDPSPIYWDNPYWIRYQNVETDRRDRVYGFVNAEWDITKGLSIQARATIDEFNLLKEERRAIGSVPAAFGVGLNPNSIGSGYGRSNQNYSETNLDLIAHYKVDLTPNLNLTALLGGNARRDYSDEMTVFTNGGLVIPYVYSLNNSVDAGLQREETAYQRGINGYYAQASLGYKSYLYFDASLRNDVASTLPRSNNSYWYPSVSGSFVFSELTKAKWLDYGKLSLNYAEVGSDAPYHSLVETYDINVPFCHSLK